MAMFYTMICKQFKEAQKERFCAKQERAFVAPYICEHLREKRE